MANSADPDELANLQKPTDLDLHCLQWQDISGFNRTRVKQELKTILQWEASHVFLFQLSSIFNTINFSDPSF